MVPMPNSLGITLVFSPQSALVYSPKCCMLTSERGRTNYHSGSPIVVDTHAIGFATGSSSNKNVETCSGGTCYVNFRAREG